MSAKPMAAALVLAGALVAIAPLAAHTPKGGLAVAVSPDGKTVVAGGDNRVLYVLDGASLAVTARVWMKTTLFGLHFNKDGSRLVVEDTQESASFVDTKTWQVLKTLPRCAWVAPSPAADLFAALDGDYKGHAVIVRSLTDGAEKARVAFPRGQRVSSFGMDAEGTRLAVLLEGKTDASEPKASHRDIPKDLKGVAREAFRQRNDGRTSTFFVFELPSGNKRIEAKTYFTTQAGSLVFFEGKTVRVVNYNNVNAAFAEDGAATVWKQASSLNYGMGLAPDQTVLWGGGLAAGSRTVVAGLEGKTFRLDRLPGWPEYFKDFAVGPGGVAYGTTSAYRLIRFDAQGAVEKAVPVY